MSAKKLITIYTASFVAMYFAMYALTYVFDHFFPNLNKAYMSALMVAPMGIVNALVLGSNYNSKALRYVVIAVSVLVLGVSLYFLRVQAFIGNEEFLRSMIPHHSSAILMCKRANITDPEIKELCGEIVETQKEEIDIMKHVLEEKY